MQNEPAPQKPENPRPNKPGNNPDEEIIARIKRQLNLVSAREKAKKDFFVPQEIESVMVNLRELIEETGVKIVEERDIQYGKQLSLSCKMRRAELNIFFGRRWFSVVELPRHGTSSELNSIMGQLIRDYFSTFND